MNYLDIIDHHFFSRQAKEIAHEKSRLLVTSTNAQVYQLYSTLTPNISNININTEETINI